jgi:uncharacterized protein
LAGAPVAELKFEWDEDKAAHNLAKHGVSFLTAAAIFANEIVERIDDREDYGEVRFIALGRVDMTIFRVVYTWRGEGVIRVISAQEAGKNEREIYYRQIFP